MFVFFWYSTFVFMAVLNCPDRELQFLKIKNIASDFFAKTRAIKPSKKTHLLRIRELHATNSRIRSNIKSIYVIE